MHLLKCLPDDGDFELTIFDSNPALLYAILSYTWTAGQEVTHKKLIEGAGTNKSNYMELRFCSESTAADGLKYL